MNRLLSGLIVFSLAGLSSLLSPTNIRCELYWSMTVTETVGDTLLVKIIPSEGLTICTTDADCPCWADYWFEMSPCPLKQSCAENTYYANVSIASFNNDWSLYLLKSESYTVSGRYYYFGSWSTSGRYNDCSQHCEVNITMETKFFPEDYVSTSESSWGRIKALFSID